MRGRNPVDRRQPNARKPNSASANLGCQVVQQCKVPVPTSASTVPYIEAFEASERKAVGWPSTTKDDDYPIIYRVLTIPNGAGFLPSTVLVWINESVGS